MSKLGNAYDSLVGVFSPEKALRNQYLRQRMQTIKAQDKRRSEQYAAAKSTRLTGTWSPVNSDVNTIIAASSATVRARVRQLVRDMPYFANAVNRIVDYTVGEGIAFQSKVLGPNGELDKKINQQIEDIYRWWADDCDIAKKLHFSEMQQLAKRQDVESGEFIFVKRTSYSRKRYLPYILQVYEADWLTTQYDTSYGPITGTSTRGPRYDVHQGIKYDRYTGEVKSFYFLDPDGWGKGIEISADSIIHGFQTLRPNQLRGISPFTPGVMLANDLADYMDAEVDAAKMAAKYLAFVRSPDAASRQTTLVQDEDNTDQYIDEMENAIVEYLNPGEDITIASNPRPGGQITPFTRLIGTMLSVVTSIPYDLLTQDYSGINYSTGRMSRNDFNHYLKPISARHVRQFCQPSWFPVLDYAVTYGKVRLPNYFADPYKFKRCEWQPPGMESIDPLRENKAMVEAMNARIRSPQENIRARGRDPEEVLKEWQQWEQWKKDYGVEDQTDQISTANAGNPAAVENQ